MDHLDENTAKRIYQELLDQIGSAYFDADFASFHRVVHVPHRFATEGKEHIVETTEHLHRSFDCFREYLAGLGVTDFVRTCTGAAFLGPDKIVGSHISDLISNGTRTREPYEVWSTMRRIDDRWQVVASQNALADTAWQAITFAQGHPTQKSTA